MLAIRRILVPVDFSPCSRDALAQAARLQKHFASQVDLLHVYYAPRSPAHRAIVVEVPGLGTRTLEELSHAEAVRELKEFMDDPETPQIEGLQSELVPGGNPYRVILERAQAGDYDLIVIGTQGLTGISHALMGSVAEKVVRHAPCPVLSVRGRGSEE